jgi:hypothetical protein
MKNDPMENVINYSGLQYKRILIKSLKMKAGNGYCENGSTQMNSCSEMEE